MCFQYFCSFLTFAIALNAVNCVPPSKVMIKSNPIPKPNSIDGISQFNVFDIPSRGYYKVEAYFKKPINIYDKIINSYSYTVYQFINDTHLDEIPFKTSTYQTTTQFIIEGLQYNTAYYVLMFVGYNGEPLNYDYAGSKHFKYEGDEVSGKFIKSDNFRFAPVFGDAKVIKNPDNSYNISTRWHGIMDQNYKRFIKSYVIEIKRVGDRSYRAREIAYNGDIFESTFSMILPNAEYQISIYAIPMSDTNFFLLSHHASSRQFFDLH